MRRLHAGARCLGIEHSAAVLPNEAAWVAVTAVFTPLRLTGAALAQRLLDRRHARREETRARMNERGSMASDPNRLRRFGRPVLGLR